MPVRTRDLRVESIRPLLPPGILIEEFPLGERAAQTVSRAREAIGRILNREDDRILVVVGPCSIHDPKRPASTPGGSSSSPTAWPRTCSS